MSDPTTPRVARVLIDSPLPQLDRLFDYAVPDAFAADAQPGVRVKVPLRSAGRMVDGFIVEIGEPDASDRPLSELDAVVSAVPVLTPRSTRSRAAPPTARRARRATSCASRSRSAWCAPRRRGSPHRRRRRPRSTTAARAVGGGVPRALPRSRRARSARGERLAVDAPPSTVRLPDGSEVGAWAVAARRGRGAHARRGPVGDPRRARSPRPRAARGGARRASRARGGRPRRLAGRARRCATPRSCATLAPAPVHRHRQSLRRLRARAPTGPHRALGRRRPAARRAAQSRRARARRRAAAAGARRQRTGVRRPHPHDRRRAARRGGMGARDPDGSPREPARRAQRDARGGVARRPRALRRVRRRPRRRSPTGPVLVQVARPGYAPVLVCAECRHPARCPHCGGPLHAAQRRARSPSAAGAAAPAPGWTCPNCSSTRVRMASAGSERTADELGRAFPGTRVIVADGAHPITHVDARPALVVATRGAEPIAVGRVPRRDPARRRPDAAGRRPADRRVVPALVVERRRARRARRARAPGRRRRTRRARSRHLDAARLRAGRARRSRAAADAADRARRRARGRRARRRRPRSTRCATRCPRSTTTRCSARSTATARSARSCDSTTRSARRSTESLRASVVSQALKTRQARRGGRRGPRNTLRVRVDVPDLDL